ncbi:MAG: VOC family protein [Alphaproteobacteria bacterium]
MLTSLDHIVLICPNIDAGIAAYTALLGFGPMSQTHDENAGVATALFQVDNTALELLAPIAGSAAEGRIQELLGGGEGSLTSLAFAAEDIDAAHHTMTRRGLSPTAITHAESVNSLTGEPLNWQRFRCADSACAGIKTFILKRASPFAPPPERRAGTAKTLDHIVINTANPDRAIAHYGARLGLSFALDRTIEAFKTRFLFFRIGGLTLEIIQRLGDKTSTDNDDSLWGITWKTDDISAAHARLSDVGLEVSDIRTGRKPGTQVFTVKSGTLGIPTLILANN